MMASWHLFMGSRFQAWLLRRIGAFSVYREGLDRTAIKAAIELLAEARRPLVVFPEGIVTRANDRLAALNEGAGFIARSAAKQRAKAEPAARTPDRAGGPAVSFPRAGWRRAWRRSSTGSKRGSPGRPGRSGRSSSG